MINQTIIDRGWIEFDEKYYCSC